MKVFESRDANVCAGNRNEVPVSDTFVFVIGILLVIGLTLTTWLIVTTGASSVPQADPMEAARIASASLLGP